MDIKVGQTAAIGARADQAAKSGGFVEGRILAIRAPRRSPQGPPRDRVERRATTKQRDPVNGKVLVLLVPDRTALPADLEQGGYRVFLRFARR